MPQVIETLLEHGADTLARNAAGSTPADLARSRQEPDVSENGIQRGSFFTGN